MADGDGQGLGVQDDEFTELATIRGIGAILNSVVGPGPSEGSERYYVSYHYLGATPDIVSIDADTGESGAAATRWVCLQSAARPS